MAQSVERRIGSAEVTGSIPVGSSEMVENKGFFKGFRYIHMIFLFRLTGRPRIDFRDWDMGIDSWLTDNC